MKALILLILTIGTTLLGYFLYANFGISLIPPIYLNWDIFQNKYILYIIFVPIIMIESLLLIGELTKKEEEKPENENI